MWCTYKDSLEHLTADGICNITFAKRVPPCQFVGWSECLKENTKTTQLVSMKLGGKMGNGPLNFGADPK